MLYFDFFKIHNVHPHEQNAGCHIWGEEMSLLCSWDQILQGFKSPWWVFSHELTEYLCDTLIRTDMKILGLKKEVPDHSQWGINPNRAISSHPPVRN
jgi:hypothetical protein